MEEDIPSAGSESLVNRGALSFPATPAAACSTRRSTADYRGGGSSYVATILGAFWNSCAVMALTEKSFSSTGPPLAGTSFHHPSTLSSIENRPWLIKSELRTNQTNLYLPSLSFR